MSKEKSCLVCRRAIKPGISPASRSNDEIHARCMDGAQCPHPASRLYTAHSGNVYCGVCGDLRGA